MKWCDACHKTEDRTTLNLYSVGGFFNVYLCRPCAGELRKLLSR